MAQSVGSLLIELQADTAAFRADLGKAQAALSSSAAQMGSALTGVEHAFRTLEMAAGAFGVGLGAAEILSFVKDSVAAAAELSNLSTQLNVSTDALQVYKLAAAQTGLSQQELETGLAHFTRAVGDAALGNDTYLDSFKRLGVGVLDANGDVRSSEAILRDVADGLAGIESPSERATLAYQLFGRQGQRFLSMFKDGAGGLDEFKSKAEELGLVLDPELIERFEQSKRRIEQWKLELGVSAVAAVDWTAKVSAAVAAGLDKLHLFSTLAADPRFNRPPAPPSAGGQAPPISGVSPGWGGAPVPLPPAARPGDGSYNPQGAREAQQEQAAAALVRGLELQRDSYQKTGAEILKMRLEREIDVAATIKAGEAVRLYTDDQVAAAVAVQRTLDAQKVQTEAQNQALRQLQGLADLEERQRLEMLAQQKASDDLRLNYQRTTRQTLELADAASASRVVFDELSGAYRVNSRELDILRETQRLMNQDMTLGRDAARQMATESVDAQEKLRSASEKSARELKQVNATISEMDSFTQGVFDHIGQAMANAFIAGGKSAVDFKSIALTVLSEVEAEFFKLLLINPLKNAIFGGNAPTLGSLGTLFGNWGTDPMALAAGGGQTWGDLATLGFAGGTDSAPGGPALVGEHGPELVNLPSGSQVIPADITSRLRAGAPSSSTVYADMRGASADAVKELRSMVVALHASVEARSVNAVLAQFRRGGRFQRLMQQ